MANIDLRAAVLAGIQGKILRLNVLLNCEAIPVVVADIAHVALRHLREIVERHDTTNHETCTECSFDPPCPTLLSLAPDYAPQALAQMEVDRATR